MNDLIDRLILTVSNQNNLIICLLTNERFDWLVTGKRKTAVELLQESKPFYVKSEQVLDRKQSLPLPHSASARPQHNRTPMLGPSLRMREQHQTPIGSSGSAHLHPAGIDDPSYTARRNKEVWNATPPVEKRRLSIRKDNPLPFVNVTAVKRFLSRPEETVFHLRKGTPKLPLPAAKLASSSAFPPPPLVRIWLIQLVSWWIVV